MNTAAPLFGRLSRRALGRLAIGTAALSLGATAAPAPGDVQAKPLPEDSVYQLAVTLTNQAGHTGPLSGWRGQPVLISMFYTSCQFVCPMLIEALRDTEAKLSAQERERVSILMVSIDPAKDSVAVLGQVAEQRQIDATHWTLARTDPATVRKLAAVLGIQYRQLKNGEFNHTTALILLDADGRIAGRTSRLGSADPAFVTVLRTATRAAPG